MGGAGPPHGDQPGPWYRPQEQAGGARAGQGHQEGNWGHFPCGNIGPREEYGWNGGLPLGHQGPPGGHHGNPGQFPGRPSGQQGNPAQVPQQIVLPKWSRRRVTHWPRWGELKQGIGWPWCARTCVSI